MIEVIGQFIKGMFAMGCFFFTVFIILTGALFIFDFIIKIINLF